MGITMSDLKDQSALSVVGAFLISRSSFEYFFADKEEIRTSATKKLILGACLFEAGKIISILALTNCPNCKQPITIHS
jgi:hypothetical protein